MRRRHFLVPVLESFAKNPLTTASGSFLSGKTTTAVIAASRAYSEDGQSKTIIVAPRRKLPILEKSLLAAGTSRPAYLITVGVDEAHLCDLSVGPAALLRRYLRRRSSLLQLVDRIALALGVSPLFSGSCEQAVFFFEQVVRKKWEIYREFLLQFDPAEASDWSLSRAASMFPFAGYFGIQPGDLAAPGGTREDLVAKAAGFFARIEQVFSELRFIWELETIRSGTWASRAPNFLDEHRISHLVAQKARVICSTFENILRQPLLLRRLTHLVAIYAPGGAMNAMAVAATMAGNAHSRVLLLGDCPSALDMPSVVPLALDQTLVPAANVANFIRRQCGRALCDPAPQSSEPGVVRVVAVHDAHPTEPVPGAFQNTAVAKESVRVVAELLRSAAGPSEISLVADEDAQKFLLDDMLSAHGIALGARCIFDEPAQLECKRIGHLADPHANF